MSIEVKRVYEPASPEDGYRVLVDRLWPRGLSKELAKLDEWAKALAPSDELRQWFHQNLECREEFRTRYFAELEPHEEELRRLAGLAKTRKVTLLYSSKHEDFNNATVLKERLDRLACELGPPAVPP